MLFAISVQVKLSGEEESLASSFEDRGMTVIFVARELHAVGMVVLADDPKPEASAVVQLLQERGVQVWMVSGDHEATVRYMAAKLGITNVAAGVKPHEKADHVKALQVGPSASCVTQENPS